MKRRTLLQQILRKTLESCIKNVVHMDDDHPDYLVPHHETQDTRVSQTLLKTNRLQVLH